MNTTWRGATSAQFTATIKGEQPKQRLLVYSGELLRLSSAHRQLQVVQGTAYLSHGGIDYIVGAGEGVTLAPTNDMALVSPVQSEALVIELFHQIDG